jgi:putative component of membrane protein insertase Oxa1/YidC/SpoIIIJ protein YidD
MKSLNRLLARPLIWIIHLYQIILSPDKSIFFPRLRGRVCAHHPHCSDYSILVLKRYGIRPGIRYAADRVLHCTPSMTIKHDPDHYRIVFFSSAPIGVPFLHTLAHDKRFEVVGVVTQPDKPSGRGMELHENIIKTEARKIFANTLSNVEGAGGVITPSRLNPEKSDE